MRKFLCLTVLAALAAPVSMLAVDHPSDQTQFTPSRQDRIGAEVRHQLLLIPQLSVFDNLSYKVDDRTVTLIGQVRNPVIKDDAQARVKHIEGVEKVNNQIEVLPVSFNDDRIRRQEARAIFSEPQLSQYAIRPLAPIHIIVKNGRVDLEGVVRTQGDKNVAGIRANGVSGVFSVQNDLQVENAAAMLR